MSQPEIKSPLEWYSEQVETLKAQLANANKELRSLDLKLTDKAISLRESQAQVRELRERERFAAQLLRQILYPSPDDITDGQSIRLAAEKLIMENHQRNAAALRSAPPSDPKLSEWDFDIPRDNRFHDWPIDKTNAGEERQDLARQGWPIPHHKLQELARRIEEGAEKVAYHGPQDSPSRSQISIEVFQQDWMPGYAAFRNDGSLEDGAKAHVCLNLSSFLGGVQIGELTAADLPYLIAESIMHEVMHVLESWANVEFSEERVEALLTKYRDKYHPEAPAYQACPEHEAPDEQAFKVRNWRDAQIAKLFEIKKVNLFCYKLYLGGVLLGADASEKRAHNRAQQILTTISKAIQETSPAPPSPAREKEIAE